MFGSADNQRIFGLLTAALVVSIVFGVTLGSASFKGNALGAEFYIGGPVAAYLAQLIFFYRLHLFDQGLGGDTSDALNHPIEKIPSIDDIENMIIELEGKTKRIKVRITRLKDAKQSFNGNSPQAAFAAMGIKPARRGG